ncbi:MAG TPA: acyl-CoA dehydrogenase family protein [Frankiaceae bacterium]|jgi:alkylation response protein AidB-like acyl-CoA dehydrogenase|nr:acyl-CoA dehydrogenase family protein [Frankiaceae bacterium]
MSTETLESVEDFRLRARTWIQANLRKLNPDEKHGPSLLDFSEEKERLDLEHDRAIQRKMFDAGLAGVAFPREYGGQGLSADHQRALNAELGGYEYPAHIQIPTFSPCAAVLLDFGTEEQKKRHLPAIFKGEEVWMQFLSEPSGGSDVAGALTTAVRDEDDWVLNGSKIWTTGAWFADWGLCLARTNWDVPKHRGLTVFILPIRQPGVTVSRIEMLNGNKEFCQEFLTDVRVPDTDRIGEVDGGWTVGVRWMFHERMLANSSFVTVPTGTRLGGGSAPGLVDVARDAGRLDDPAVRDLIGEARTIDLVGQQLNKRVGRLVTSGQMSDQAAAIGRLFLGISNARTSTISYEIAGAIGGAWSDDDGAAAESGTTMLMRQTSCIGGGTTEMARNVISERVLGMPRERSHDPGLPFRDVPRSASSARRG